jgi:hypothetical protein
MPEGYRCREARASVMVVEDEGAGLRRFFGKSALLMILLRPMSDIP